MRAIFQERTARTVTVKRNLHRQRQELNVRLREINGAIKAAGARGKTSDNLSLADFRAALGWSRYQLAQVICASDRAIVNWEGNDPISPVYASKLRELQSIYHELKQLMTPQEIGPWLLAEMEEFEGRSPADLIRKGETGRLWASLYYLRSGMPD